MPCALCGDIIPTEVARCPACGAWARRRDFRAVGVAVFMLLGFNAFVALGSGISLLRLEAPLRGSTHDTYDPGGTEHALAPYSDVFLIGGVMAGVTGLLYLAWLWRAYGQSPGPHRHRRAWVVFGWLCPVVNLWLPPRLVYDVWVNSGRYRVAERHAAALVVAGWWACVLTGIGLARMFSGGHGVQTLADARFSVHVGVAAAAFQALAAALCMATVFQITRLQIARDS
ncbi:MULTISPECIES: DUF4328 domain-containing protein [Thermomonosporaceae]|uniref:DUF4328 domain-containing protein n=1 Tax=Thermomonosporaceae TaxID=2012 RepID=UPI00255AA293|nr:MULTISPECIES: DUF4328 domain-containing protein [Thermomonosporaceae]MDL4777482.1 DUF4328 domain-containing protein [Actinomadura xylanilytica]